MPHIHHLYDYVVTAYVTRDNKVLLVDHPRYSQWLPVGGHIELDENPEVALYREIKEETGLEVHVLQDDRPAWKDRKLLISPAYIDVHEANSPHKHISFTYFMEAKNGEGILSTEHSKMKWFSKEEIDDSIHQLSEPIKFYAHEALKRASL